MHREVIRFLLETKSALPQYFENTRVLEIGSRRIGDQPTVKQAFKNCEYIGVDISDGPGVDWIGKGHEFKSKELFDVVVSCECFEHDPYWDKTVTNMINHLKWNGLLIFTCASTGRPEHGTRKSSPHSSPATVEIEGWADYYRNLTENDFKLIVPEFTNGTMVSGMWVNNEASRDLYYRGWKR
jgi:SAM-dependent methyltransferase